VNENDINIVITDREGVIHDVIAPTDMSINLMELIKIHELENDGTIGICGGMNMCASCQCYIESQHNIIPKSDDEEAMLSEALYLQSNSRLACQIPITIDLDNLKIKIAPVS
jgi:2Fe-2S ferredoxin|tara:strand:- start:1631 stop:1966 length:336 start_codon:yes stop_codon:yes gene_type:complete